GAGAAAGFLVLVVEGNEKPECDAEGEQEQPGDLAHLSGERAAEELEHLKGAHEIPLRMNADGSRGERVELLAERPRKDGGHQGKDVEGDEPQGQILAQEAGHEGDALAVAGMLGFFARRDGVAVLLDEPEMEAEKRKEERWEHDDMEREEALHSELGYFGSAAKHGGDGRANEGNGVGDLKADLGGEVGEL